MFATLLYRRRVHSIGVAGIAFVLCGAVTAQAANGPESITTIISQTCVDCHNDETSEGGLNLTRTEWKLGDVKTRQQWVQVFDRVAKHEMPPEGNDLTASDRQQFLTALSDAIHSVDYGEVRAQGRGPIRRLTRREYEQNLRDVLQLPHLDIRDLLPPDREKHHCNRVAEVLDMSRIQMEAYLNAADVALRAAVASGVAPRKAEHHRLPATRMFQQAGTFGGREAMFYAKNSQLIPLSGADLGLLRKENTHDPDVELAIFRSASWPYYGYPDTFIAKEPGEYRVKFSARAVRQVRDFGLRPAHAPIPMTFRARKRSGPDVSGDVRATGGLIDVQPQVGVYETTIRLKVNETFEYSLLGLPVPRAINPDDGPLYYDFPPMPADGHPGIAYQWLEITGPIDSKVWPPASHQVLFGNLPIRGAGQGGLPIELVSSNPQADAVRLLRRFIAAVERQSTSAESTEVYERLVLDELKAGTSLAEALVSGYSAFLCSGEFLYLQEPFGESLPSAVASRLSHFLANSRPDAALLDVALQGSLANADSLRRETDRLIAKPSFDEFVKSFTDYWLGLKDIRRDEPDVRLYPEYRFDDYLIESMEAESRAFFRAMVRDNLPVTVLVDSDFALVNDRLASHYDLSPVTGSQLRRVELPPTSPFGGLLTQAAIMKVSADGTATSPVVRGAWIMDRILGDPPPAPPASVPAVEPDIRGATTIREQLARHAADPACAGCHARFDPIGFALENFDIMGAWRNRYRSLQRGERVTGIDRAGHDFVYHVAGAVDASGRLRDGREFGDVRELKAILRNEPRQLARNLLQRLVVYSTGTPIRFSDRREIEAMLDRCREDGYRTRDLFHALIQSRIFTGLPRKSGQAT